MAETFAHHPPRADSDDAFIATLSARGALDKGSLDRLHRARSASAESTAVIIQQLGLMPEADLVSALAEYTGLPAASAPLVAARQIDLEKLNLAFLRRARVLPVELEDGAMALAMADPLDDASARAIAYQLDMDLPRVVAPVSAIDAALGAAEARPDERDVRVDAASADIEALQDLASGAPVIRFVAAAIEQAAALGASDIHFEPTETDLRVRMRIDGALQDMEPAPYSMKLAVTSRLKVLARLDVAEQRLPQDGRAKVAVRGRDIDLRVSTAPTLLGESVVVRLLDRASVNLDFEALGFSEANRQALHSILASPHGVAFVSGPTGSGKTTTLYAALVSLNDPRRKIFSVEDPVEYRLRGVNQVQVNPKIGLTFASALRSLLRQDPDIMMVGEIRDPETAEIAVQAALTGHLVLATIHTNTAAATVTRLIDMGVDEYLIASSASAFIAQRLVGVLCDACATPAPVPVETLRRFGLTPPPNANIRKAVGCDACRRTGYSGRTTISEIIRVTPEVEAAIARRAGAAEIERIAASQGMTSMAQDGLQKALQGVTSVEEVLRAVKA